MGGLTFRWFIDFSSETPANTSWMDADPSDFSWFQAPKRVDVDVNTIPPKTAFPEARPPLAPAPVKARGIEHILNALDEREEVKSGKSSVDLTDINNPEEFPGCGFRSYNESGFRSYNESFISPPVRSLKAILEAFGEQDSVPDNLEYEDDQAQKRMGGWWGSYSGDTLPKHSLSAADISVLYNVESIERQAPSTQIGTAVSKQEHMQTNLQDDNARDVPEELYSEINNLREGIERIRREIDSLE